MHSDIPAASQQAADPIASVKAELEFAVTNQERIDVLTRAKAHADRQWFYWKDVARYIESQMQVVEYEAQLKLPL